MSRHSELTASLVTLSRVAAERLREDLSPENAADACHAIETLAKMVEKQHEGMLKLASALPNGRSDPHG